MSCRVPIFNIWRSIKPFNLAPYVALKVMFWGDAGAGRAELNAVGCGGKEENKLGIFAFSVFDH